MINKLQITQLQISLDYYPIIILGLIDRTDNESLDY
jgi:hypothetical protein